MTPDCPGVVALPGLDPDPDDLVIPAAALPTPDPPADPGPSGDRPRRGLPPWFKFVSMSDPIPGLATARARDGRPKTVKRRAGGFRPR